MVTVIFKKIEETAGGKLIMLGSATIKKGNGGMLVGVDAVGKRQSFCLSGIEEINGEIKAIDWK